MKRIRIGKDINVQCISGCKIYNNHRGGISNLPHESVVENCDFVKNYHMNGDSPLNCSMTVCRHYSGLYIYQILQTKNGTWYRNGVKTGETPSWSVWTKQSIGTNFISSPTENPDNIVSPATYYYEGTYVTPEGGESVVANVNYPSNAFQYNDLGGALGSTLAVEINPNNLRIRQILTTPYGKW